MTKPQKSSTRQKALRDRRKAEGLKTLTRYVKLEWIKEIDALITKLQENEK
jgi:L-lactate utilization protein LutB